VARIARRVERYNSGTSARLIQLTEATWSADGIVDGELRHVNVRLDAPRPAAARPLSGSNSRKCGSPQI
jgi:hypothetical protein